MTPAIRAVLGLALPLALTGGMAVLSRAPYRAHPDDAGAIRLSWSARPERIEACRDVPAEELERRAPHMRQPVVCEGRSAIYRLDVARNGLPLAAESVLASGARHDRPIYLFRDFPTPPGRHALRVRFALAEDAAAAGLPTGARPGEVLPRVLALDTTVTLGPREIVLVTYDPGLQALRLGARASVTRRAR